MKGRATPARMPGPVRPCLAVALLSGSVVCFEIGLTRLFSFLFHYHYTFLILSGAVCGLGLGALLAFRIRVRQEHLLSSLGLAAFAYGLSLWLTTGLLVHFPRGGILPLVAAAALPFILAGIFLSLLFRERHRDSQRLYFCDLTGAAGGSLLIIPCLEWLGGVDSLLTGGMLAALAGLWLVWPSRWGSACFLGFLAAFAVQLQAPFLKIDMEPLRAAADKPMFRAMGAQQNPGKLLETRWSAYARTDLMDRTGDTGLNLYVDGGAGSYMFRFDGDFRKLFFLRGEALFFPYYFGPQDRALILGPGAGADVLYALMTGWKQIDGVEINPEIVRTVRERGEYNGWIYDYRNVHIHIGDGRNYLERSDRTYDLIALPLVYAEAADLVGYALRENYLFTRQAFAGYFAHLRPGGRLAVAVHNHPLMLRVVATLGSLWESEGKKPADLLEHLVVINGTRSDPRAEEAFRPLLLVQKTPYARAQLRELVETAGHLGLQPYFVPHFQERRAVARLRFESLEEFVGAVGSDIAPVTDDRPFFYDVAVGLDERLEKLLISAGLASLLFLLLPGFRKKARKSGTRIPAPVTFALFVTFLGGAYMLVEIYLLQRFGLFLGYPTLSIAVTLFGLLLASGAGSLLGGALPALNGSRGIALAALTTAAAAAVSILLHDALLPAALPLGAEWRVLIAFLLVLPLGLLMGVCFPATLRLIGRSAPEEIPWMWGVNGISSVFGSVLAVVAGMEWGTNWILLAGAGGYALAGAVLLVGSMGPPPPIDAEVDTGTSVPWKRAGTFVVLIAVVWYAVFTSIAARYWQAAPVGDERPAPPPVVREIWPPGMENRSF